MLSSVSNRNQYLVPRVTLYYMHNPQQAKHFNVEEMINVVLKHKYEEPATSLQDIRSPRHKIQNKIISN